METGCDKSIHQDNDNDNDNDNEDAPSENPDSQQQYIQQQDNITYDQWNQQ